MTIVKDRFDCGENSKQEHDEPEVGDVLEVLDWMEDDSSLVDADHRARLS